MDVPERDAASLALGQVANLRFVAYPEQQFEAKVQLIEPELTAESGSPSTTSSGPSTEYTTG